MKRQLVLISVAALMLAGCSASPAPTKVVTPKPTPTVMSVADAGQLYLKSVCPTNAAVAASNSAYQARDLAAIQSTAASLRDLIQSQARIFDDDTILWPAGISVDLKVLRDADLGAASSYDAVSKATSLDIANGIAFGDQTPASAASQRVRLRLNLSADTSKGC